MSDEFEEFLKAQMQQDYMKQLQSFIKKERQSKEIYPAPGLILNAFKLTEYWSIKVVIIGNEPYNTPNTDMGIAYSSIGQAPPPELQEILKEIRRSEYSHWPFKPETMLFKTCNLTQWVKQGVLMLNRVLTAEKGVKHAHKGKGWERFNIETIKMVDKHYNRLVFMLWGKDNWHLEKYISEKHLLLKANSPGSGKFYGCDHFKLCNNFILETYNKTRAPINWCLLN